jgi:hypothetical protein
MPDDILSHEMLVSGSKMSWEQALADPHLMRLGDWLARQLGEREMAKLEAEGSSKEDLEKQHLRSDYRAERLKVVMVKEPSSSRFRPFVQVWVSKAESHAACPMSRGAAMEVKLEKEEQTRVTKNVKYNKPDYSLMDTNHSDTSRTQATSPTAATCTAPPPSPHTFSCNILSLHLPRHWSVSKFYCKDFNNSKYSKSQNTNVRALTGALLLARAPPASS